MTLTPCDGREPETLELTRKELILLYISLKKKENPDPARLDQLANRIERTLFDHLTIDDIENIGAFYRSLK